MTTAGTKLYYYYPSIAAGYVLPTSVSDPESAATDEANMYDNDFDTFGYFTAANKYLTFTHTSAACSKIKIKASGHLFYTDVVDSRYNPNISVDVYTASSWVNVYSGTVTNATIVELSFTQQTAVSAFRIKVNGSCYYNSSGDYNVTEIYEIQPYLLPEWLEEASKIEVHSEDSLAGRSRTLTAIISNPKNTKDSTYTPYIKAKLVEKRSAQTIFSGRLEFSQNIYHNDYGPVLQIIARDYAQSFFNRIVNTDYSGTPYKRSELIAQIISDYAYPGTLTTNIDASGSSETVKMNYAKSNKTVIEIFSQLAKEDPWDDVISGYGYDFYVDDDQVFQYFKRGSKAANLTVAFGISSTMQMLSNYAFSDEPREFYTRATVRGNNNLGGEVSAIAVNYVLESSYQIIKEVTDYVYGSNMNSSEMFTICTTRANSLLNTGKVVVTRGVCQIVGYPIYGSSNTPVRVGEKVNVWIPPKNISAEYLLLDVKYDELPGFATLELVNSFDGKSYSDYSFESVMRQLNRGTNIELNSAKIGDLIVGTAQIGECSITKLTAGNLNVVGTIGVGGSWTTGSSGDTRIVIDNTQIAGYNSVTKEFSISATTGKGEFGAGTGTIGEHGIRIDDSISPGVAYIEVAENASEYRTIRIFGGALALYYQSSPELSVRSDRSGLAFTVQSGQFFSFYSAGANGPVNINLQSGTTMTGLSEPTNDNDAATKNYVDAHGATLTSTARTSFNAIDTILRASTTALIVVVSVKHVAPGSVSFKMDTTSALTVTVGNSLSTVATEMGDTITAVVPPNWYWGVMSSSFGGVVNGSIFELG
jgi:hypothetical protein